MGYVVGSHYVNDHDRGGYVLNGTYINPKRKPGPKKKKKAPVEKKEK